MGQQGQLVESGFKTESLGYVLPVCFAILGPTAAIMDALLELSVDIPTLVVPLRILVTVRIPANSSFSSGSGSLWIDLPVDGVTVSVHAVTGISCFFSREH